MGEGTSKPDYKEPGLKNEKLRIVLVRKFGIIPFVSL
jgi:hypothetical protein